MACHQTDYDGQHSGSGYPTTCSACHTATVWSDGTFNHTTISGGFELLGTHTSKPCTACHTPTAWSNGTLAEPCLTCHGGSPPPGTTFPAPNWSGFDKTTFVGTAHDTQQSGTDSCRNCHAQHGASQQSFLLDTYVMSDGNRWTQGDGDYQLCWNCHDEDYVMNQDNAFEDLHDKHVNGEDTPCAKRRTGSVT